MDVLGLFPVLVAFVGGFALRGYLDRRGYTAEWFAATWSRARHAVEEPDDLNG